MRIVMVTNNFLPHVGGVARSVATFADYYHRCGHSILVVAPRTEPGPGPLPYEVLDVPAVSMKQGRDLAAPLPVPGYVASAVKRFSPDIIHAHHPFLLGDTALRLAATHGVPLVFTHHTLYEHYTHYAPNDRPSFKLFIMDLATGYANLCTRVFGPSASTATLLRRRGVVTPISIVPSGISVERFSGGDRSGFRKSLDIPPDSFVLGTVGRLAHEKNLAPLAEAMAACIASVSSARAIIVGDGPAAADMQRMFSQYGLTERVRFTGTLTGSALADAYAAMDAFVFTSQSETQGLVLAEAMAAGVPVAAFDAPGVRDIVRHGENGWLVGLPSAASLAFVLRDAVSLPLPARQRLQEGARRTAAAYTVRECGERALAAYAALLIAGRRKHPSSMTIRESAWEGTRRRMTAEWELWQMRLRATKSLLASSDA
ncbi:MAG: glycosyl transferase family 1 [Candidatus Andersenbacteria bacterium CG10_big_fil_rev_8_21_14_0_10_54_11]|uniref:Glycosyl transferase family 1 n=1 Tax=Candidatus Andersenbacteria bacterium CG10_big_fil_rev_8_21_14_0_10_54_11 TaxID=1974485 RepID=A0A2M6WYB5_9BACT|nr:MAG: glycosyl transferase family 1 [Candidatus Andersenbacteria bacterium CG10_big_fil_rev_8_21_14_0_10_54_11]